MFYGHVEYNIQSSLVKKGDRLYCSIASYYLKRRFSCAGRHRANLMPSARREYVKFRK